MNPAKHLARVFAALLAAVPFLVNLIPVLLLGTVLTRFLELFTRIRRWESVGKDEPYGRPFADLYEPDRQIGESLLQALWLHERDSAEIC